ncbi:MAG: ThuA domain-containing protein, partial [Bacteroidota bacterium]|nr:ThuA domain-containing protein [Bacteroidota bacterium]
MLLLFSVVDVHASAGPNGYEPDRKHTPVLHGFDVLVFSKTAGYRHDSISAGIAALESLGTEHEFDVVATEDASVFSDEGLSPFDVIVFLNTT